MAKDPAFLFYPGDWLGGTMLLTRHQKGCYIDLLMAQFNSGPLSLDQIKLVLGQDQATWTVLQDKFQQDNSGRFFNQKLATEIEKRKAFVQSRSSNKKGKTKTYHQSYENHMIHHMENENRNEDDNVIEGKGVQGENQKQPLEIGTPNGHRVTIRAKYITDVPKIVHSLEAFFTHTGQLQDIRTAGWDKHFKAFMQANPGASFSDDDHLYHSFKKFSTKAPEPTEFKKKFNKNEVFS